MDFAARLGGPGRILPGAGGLHLYKAVVELEAAGASAGPAWLSFVPYLRARAGASCLATGKRSTELRSTTA